MAEQLRFMTPKEYLAFEKQAEQRHEYVNGDHCHGRGKPAAQSADSGLCFPVADSPIQDQLFWTEDQKPQAHYCLFRTSPMGLRTIRLTVV